MLVVVAIGLAEELEGQPRLARVGEGIANAQVVGRETEHAGHDGLVGAMPGERMGEASQQVEFHMAGHVAG